jgi:hypothetical protein
VVASLGADNDVIRGLVVAPALPETSAARAWGVSAVCAAPDRVIAAAPVWAVAVGAVAVTDGAVADGAVADGAGADGAVADGAAALAAAGAADSSPMAARIASSHAWAASAVGAV